MSRQTTLKILFAGIFLTLLTYNLWASFQQPVWQWSGLTSGVDRYWTIATFLDAYCGFITFYVWVFYKESSGLKRPVGAFNSSSVENCDCPPERR